MQLLLQFPCHFEFNLTYLLKLAEHTYSNLFGNFLVNNLAERRRLKIKERTRSIWGYLRSHPSKFRNFLFVRRDEVLWARCEVRDLLLWQDVYMGESPASQIIKEVTSSPSANGSVEETDSGNDREEEDEEDKLQVVPAVLCFCLTLVLVRTVRRSPLQTCVRSTDETPARRTPVPLSSIQPSLGRIPFPRSMETVT